MLMWYHKVRCGAGVTSQRVLRVWELEPKPRLVVCAADAQFIKCVKTNEVQQVAIDGLHINFSLRPSSPLLQKRLQSVMAAAAAATSTSSSAASSSSSPLPAGAVAPAPAAPPRVAFYTVRPADYAVPYDSLEAHSVPFSAVERRENRFLTMLGCAHGRCMRAKLQVHAQTNA